MFVTVSGPRTSDESDSISRRSVSRRGCRTPQTALELSLWYRFVDGVFECATGADAAVVDYLDYDASVSFEISTNEPPYCGVRGNGTATMTADEDKTVLTESLHRYLGGTDSPLADHALPTAARNVRRDDPRVFRPSPPRE